MRIEVIALHSFPHTPSTSPPAAPTHGENDPFPTSISADAGNPLFLTSSSLAANGTTSSARLCRMTVPGLTVLAVPHLFQPGLRRTSLAEPLFMLMATVPPLDWPTITCGWCLSNSSWAMRTASSKSSSGSLGWMTSWPCWAERRLVAARNCVPAVKEEDFHGIAGPLGLSFVPFFGSRLLVFFHSLEGGNRLLGRGRLYATAW